MLASTAGLLDGAAKEGREAVVPMLAAQMAKVRFSSRPDVVTGEEATDSWYTLYRSKLSSLSDLCSSLDIGGLFSWYSFFW